ncbi:MAG TPA: NAD(P)H-hydrate dehydratase [Candidatus Limnocylindrales bacterium]|nr:NAD(P)H-hydrate dehydratase [Candidatus Limnocylindrales bacterium]
MAGADAGAGALAVLELDDRTVAPWIPVRPVRGHKGSFGKLLVVAGSLDYAGAAILVCHAAGRAGAGLVRLALPESLQPILAGRAVEATTLALPETDQEGEVDPEAALDRLLDQDHDAAVMGPGLRPGLATVELVAAFLGAGATDGQTPATVDAEALNSLASLPAWPERLHRPCVLTPHLGEFARLCGQAPISEAEGADLVADDAARARVAGAAARAWGQVLLLKGARTVIAAPDGRLARAPFENPALASGGTGDVLSGTIGALLAQGLASFEAACLGVYLHGAAGEAIRDRFGDSGLLASDLPDEVARARRRLSAVRDRSQGGHGGRLGFVVDDGSPREVAH